MVGFGQGAGIGADVGSSVGGVGGSTVGQGDVAGEGSSVGAGTITVEGAQPLSTVCTQSTHVSISRRRSWSSSHTATQTPLVVLSSSLPGHEGNMCRVGSAEGGAEGRGVGCDDEPQPRSG